MASRIWCTSSLRCALYQSNSLPRLRIFTEAYSTNATTKSARGKTTIATATVDGAEAPSTSITEPRTRRKRRSKEEIEKEIKSDSSSPLRRRRGALTQDVVQREEEEGKITTRRHSATAATAATEKKRKKKNSDFVASPSSSFPHLPEPEDWDACFQKGGGWKMGHHFFIGNEQTATNVIEAMNLDSASEAVGSKLTILEGYPGPGTLTRMFLKNKNVERVVAMEDHPSFFPWLKSLQTDSGLGENASNLKLHNKTCYEWETYTQLLQAGDLDNVPFIKEVRQDPDRKSSTHDSDDWKAPSPMIFFAHLPSTVHGEQLLAQFITSIANRLWQFQYCRMPLYLVCSEHVARRCIAPPGDKLRGKLSALAQALGEPQIILGSSNFLPHENHFWPSRPMVGPRLPLTKGVLGTGKVSTGSSKEDNCLLLIQPRLQPMVSGVEMEAYEFILRNLFVLRKTEIGKAITHMAPGALSILDKMQAGHPAMASVGAVQIDPQTVVEDLTIPQLVGLAKIFERWPFRPVNLFEEGVYLHVERNRGGLV